MGTGLAYRRRRLGLAKASVTAKSGDMVYGNVLKENTPIGRGLSLFPDSLFSI
jgi:hypothetical protein